MSQRKSLVGNKYGHLTVREMLYGYQGRKHTFVRCECDCGNEKIIDTSHLKRDNLSCGCMTTYYRSLHNRTNEIGKTYGYLTIKDIDYSVRPSQATCQCKCGNIITVSKADVVSGHTQSCGCYQSQQTSKANTKDYTDYISDFGVKIIKRAEQKNGVWHWWCKCPKCGNEFITLPAKVISNHTTSCGCKKQSNMEFFIEQFLIKNNIKYKKEVRFRDCKYRHTLPFDFGIYDDNNNLLFLIEYDGEQHYKSIKLFGGNEAFVIRQKCDEIKNQYCQQHNIKLIRIDYTKTIKEIENILLNI